MASEWFARMRSLLESPAPAVLTTYRKDGSAHTSPVWFTWAEGAFEVVIRQDDVKLANLRRDPRFVFVVFETVRPFRGIEVRGTAEVIDADVTPVRLRNASRYLGAESGKRYAEAGRSRPGAIVRLNATGARVWDLSALP